MNYRHDFRAGNVADACVSRSRVVLRLGAEPTPFRNIMMIATTTGGGSAVEHLSSADHAGLVSFD